MVCVGGEIFKPCKINSTNGDQIHKGVVCDNRRIPEFYYKEVLDRYSSQLSIEFGYWAGMVTAEGIDSSGDSVLSVLVSWDKILFSKLILPAVNNWKGFTTTPTVNRV